LKPIGKAATIVAISIYTASIVGGGEGQRGVEAMILSLIYN